MTHDPIPPEITPVAAGFVIEWLCGLFGEPDPEAVKAHLVSEVVRRRGIDAETAWVEGRETRDTRHETEDRG